VAVAGGSSIGSRASVRVDMIFDPSCPWCYIGKRQLAAAIALRPGIVIDVHWWPFLLNPDVPPLGVERQAYLCRKYGSTIRLRRMQSAIVEVGRGVGLTFAFERIRRTPSTLAAHRLVRYASARGRADAAIEALFFAYFVAGRDIGDIAVLVSLGLDLGFEAKALRHYLISPADREEVLLANQRAHRLGINGVPTFVFDRSMVICGAQEPVTLSRMLDASRYMGALAGPLLAEADLLRMSPPPEGSFD
jgi:predicted DsbA family dithiol-disulfide isomerase